MNRSQLDELYDIAKTNNLEILKITLKQEGPTKGLEELLSESRKVKELSPIDVFKLKCKEQDFDLDTNAHILDAFHEALQIVKKG